MKRRHTSASSSHGGRSGETAAEDVRAGNVRAGNDVCAEEDERTEEQRRRVGLMIELTARAGAYRKGILAAVGRLSPAEASILADLERNGLQVPQLHDVLCGGHVLVDDPRLYETWRSAEGSRPRLSSHHRDIDKQRYPDIGMRGQVVREKLHGRTAQGTWLQLEKTPAAFGKGRLPGPNDVRHLADYVIYRVTRSNVGPWGLSRMTERYPMYLSPVLAVPTSLTPPVARSLTRALRRIETDDDVTAVSRDLASRFPPPDREDLAAELGRSLSGRAGRGLFGSSDVWVTEAASPSAAEVVREEPAPPRTARAWLEPPQGPEKGSRGAGPEERPDRKGAGRPEGPERGAA